MATLTLRDVRKSYGPAEVIKGVHLDVADRVILLEDYAATDADRESGVELVDSERRPVLVAGPTIPIGGAR